MNGSIGRWALGLWTLAVTLFIVAPLVIIVLYAFDASNIQAWPIQHFSFKWFASSWHDSEIFTAFLLSIRVALVATALAVALGVAAAFAVHRFKFFGRETVSLIVVLPIALPGVITGVALASYFTFLGINLSYWTIVIGHVTFCIVVVYNSVIARLRRLPRSLREASMDLGANASRTFVRITLPLIWSAVFSGALLAFALSFNEVIVTNFTAGAENTLPLWIFGQIRLGQKLPEVNVVVSVVILASMIPVILSYLFMRRKRAAVE